LERGWTNFRIKARLSDNEVLVFDLTVPEELLGWAQRLFPTLLIILSSTIAIAIVAVRWLTRPLRLLAEAATKLGRNLRQARSRSDRISSTTTPRLAHAVTGAQLTW